MIQLEFPKTLHEKIVKNGPQKLHKTSVINQKGEIYIRLKFFFKKKPTLFKNVFSMIKNNRY